MTAPVAQEAAQARPSATRSEVAQIAFSYAFQPIVDVEAGSVVSYEALIRGTDNGSAHGVLSRVPAAEKYWFDIHSRSAAIQLAARLGIATQLNLNIYPRSVFDAGEALVETAEAVFAAGLRLDQIVLEISEAETIEDLAEFGARVSEYRSLGLQTAIDDFGAGFSGLNLLAEFQPDQVKIDMSLVRGIAGHGPRQAIARAVIQVCFDLGIDPVAEGVETVQEYEWFREQGVRLFQGYLFGRPQFEALCAARFPRSD